MSADGNELDWVERTKVAIGQSKGQVSRENVREVHRTSPFANCSDLDLVLSVREMSLNHQSQKEETVFPVDQEAN